VRVSQERSREAVGGLTMAAGLLTGLTVVPGLLFQAGMDFTAAYMSMGAMTILASAWLAHRGMPLIATPSVPLAAWLSHVVIISRGCSWQEVMGLSAAVSLVGFALFSFAAGRKALEAVPDCIRSFLATGLGLMLIMQGMVQGRLILASPWSAMMMGNFQDPLAYWSFLGTILGAVLLAGRFSWALGTCFLLTALFTYMEGFWILPPAPVLLPEGMEKVLGQAVLWGSWSDNHLAECFLLGLVLLLTVCSESFCLWQVSCQGERSPGSMLKGLAGFSFFGAFLGCLPLSLSPLSSVGWTAGGRKGRTTCIALGALMILWLLEPLLAELASFPAMTVPLLLLSGVVMIKRQLAKFSPGELALEDFLPGLAGAMLMAMSFNIAAGLGVMLLGRVLLLSAAGRRSELKAAEWVLALLFLLYFMVGYL